MDFKYYQSLVDDAQGSDNKELWVAEYGYPADCPYEPEQLLEVLSIIYDVAHMDIKPLVTRANGLTRFAEEFRIPYKTAKKWQYGERMLPEHELRLIGYVLVADAENKAKEE